MDKPSQINGHPQICSILHGLLKQFLGLHNSVESLSVVQNSYFWELLLLLRLRLYFVFPFSV
ncbi:hypothetical protein Csa_005445 [Cucumis sativus]|uniref:Uncharacterized protein n=1 Tax=Cucumis sativus TaxID=3659 RepID=A0A0A0KCR8_CUCSA|nr:hypothetical protein Csa_005445 [Cucumis sativus]